MGPSDSICADETWISDPKAGPLETGRNILPKERGEVANIYTSSYSPYIGTTKAYSRSRGHQERIYPLVHCFVRSLFEKPNTDTWRSWRRSLVCSGRDMTTMQLFVSLSIALENIWAWRASQNRTRQISFATCCHATGLNASIQNSKIWVSTEAISSLRQARQGFRTTSVTQPEYVSELRCDCWLPRNTTPSKTDTPWAKVERRTFILYWDPKSVLGITVRVPVCVTTRYARISTRSTTGKNPVSIEATDLPGSCDAKVFV